ncbi:hypothetical protein FF36_00700 [Frankia torreyi]|uniref:Uncharacterized protein n=1 Tax=Frankia torreyi TaxID=1856 RepID=A0A0D8BLE6_9ACTN|nr:MULTISPECIES: hypothetical protein [Frankia]KJE25088.1 hypothetical protein FF36_00700 [Frankia torreyi]KQC36965.1 hypothetical protein UK82_18435 [Frankia sp. ACN1ag]KQM07280.1 hypothetical protein FF86_1004179 [Frankia sp. CpI1-P]
MNIREFYGEEPRRQASAEVPFGDGWTDHHDIHSTYRLSWVEDTREIYSVREPHPGGILARYLDQLRVDQADIDELRVEILAVADREAIEAALAGWPAVMEEHDSLRWARRQLISLSSAGATP